MKDMIKVSKISRHYNVGKQIVKALDSITVNVKRNEYVSFMGPSGSGKSTLMNIIGSYWNLRWRSLVRKGFAQGRPSRRNAGTSACQTDRQGWSCWKG